MPTQDLKFVANPTQKKFIQSKASASLFTGRMREGKSAGLVWSVFHHTRHNPGAEWLLFRDTWTNFERTTMREFFKWFPPGVMGIYKAEPRRFTWQCTIDGQEMKGAVTFMGLDSPQDASKLQSMTLGAFGCDEVAPGLDAGGISEEVFDFAMTRISQPGLNYWVAKLVENNPDESHWTYSRFVDPGTEGYECFQPDIPENILNIKPGFYQDLKNNLKGRPDLWLRFGLGKFGFTQIGKAVTPQWNPAVHLAEDLKAIRGLPLKLFWDFGLNPTAVVAQITPTGSLNCLWCVTGNQMGVEEYIEGILGPALAAYYPNFTYEHIGDPAGKEREQSSSKRSAVSVIRKMIGGGFRAGVVSEWERLDALKRVLLRTNIIKIDKTHARDLWHALRGGWHRHVSAQGIVGGIVKDIHSHPGDALSYGVSVLYPVRRLGVDARRRSPIPVMGINGALPLAIASPSPNKPFIGNKGVRLPSQAHVIMAT